MGTTTKPASAAAWSILVAIGEQSDNHGFSSAEAESVRPSNVEKTSMGGYISGLVRQDLVEVEEYRTGWGKNEDSADGDYLHLTEAGWKLWEQFQKDKAKPRG